MLIIEVDESRYSQFESVLHGHGLVIKGGRFCHICASHDKGQAVAFLKQIKSSGMYNIISIGIGDSTNDLEMFSS